MSVYRLVDAIEGHHSLGPKCRVHTISTGSGARFQRLVV